MTTKATTRFRRLVQVPEILQLPCVHDALAAVIAEQAGFQAVCVGGYGASASLLGKPDVNLLSMTEMADHVARIADAVSIPVFADADTGHGNTTNVARTVRRFEKAGAAGLFMEDQVSPKRCGHMTGKDVIPRQEMLAKIHAALDARQDQDFVIMGRTDAIAVHGLDEAIARANLMREAGADLLFVEAPESIETMQRIRAEVDGPLFTAFVEGGCIPPVPAQQLESMGYAIVAYACSGLYAAAHAMRETFRHIRATGSSNGLERQMIPFGPFNDLLGLPEIRAAEARFAATTPKG